MTLKDLFRSQHKTSEATTPVSLPVAPRSQPVSPLSAATELPAIDVVDLSDMPKSERLLSAKDGKASRRGSRIDKSDDGHTLLNRHELMRRAMAHDDAEDDDNDSVFEDEHVLTASSTMPTLVTPAPVRAELPRSDSLEEVLSPIRDPGRSQSIDYDYRARSETAHAMTKSATSASLLHPPEATSRPSSIRSLSPSRLRKGSDASSKGGIKGVAGALAASAAAGIGVGAGMAMGIGHGDEGHGHSHDRNASSAASERSSASGFGAADGLEETEDSEWPGAQVTGFAVASSKRNQEFHQLFSQVPEDDYLIEDYGCALTRDILIQGRLYVSENHLCFKANIFGWVTNVVLPFGDIVSIEKRMTAFVIPNAIQVATLNAKHNFTSFLSRDATYDLMLNIWRLSHPGVSIEAAEQADLTDEYSEEEGDSTRARLKRKLRGTKHGMRDDNLAAVGAAAARSRTPMKSSSPAPGGKRAAHRKTSCECSDKEHFSVVALDTTYPTVPDKIYNLLFTSGFMKEFWTDNQKLTELQVSDWSSQEGGNLKRNISYIKQLAGGFGPKQTKCHLVDEAIHVDADNYSTTLTSTTTPDVPSGNSFAVKTKTCITWEGTGNVSHVLVTCMVDWSGRSMIKGIIDRACIDGQKQYYKDLDEAVRKYLTEHTSEFREEGDDNAAVEEIARAATPAPRETKADEPSSNAQGDGIMATLTDILGGAFEAISEDITKAIMVAIIVVLLLLNIYTWRRAGRPPPIPAHHGPNGAGGERIYASPEAIAAIVKDTIIALRTLPDAAAK